MSLELLQVLASTPDALVEAEEMYDEDDAKTPAAARRGARGPRPRRAQGAQRRGAQLSTRTLKRYVGAPVDDLRAHVTWLARVKPTTLALPTAAPAACASGTLRVVKAQEPHDVAMLFDGRRWHPWTYDAWSTDECVDAFEMHVAFHYEVCAKLVEQRGGGDAYEGPTILVKLANRPQLMRPVALRCTKRLVDVARQYPLKKAILIGAPPLFAAAWRGIRPLLDEATHAKVEFMDDEAAGDRRSAIVGEGRLSPRRMKVPQPGPLSIGNIEKGRPRGSRLLLSPWTPSPLTPFRRALRTFASTSARFAAISACLRWAASSGVSVLAWIQGTSCFLSASTLSQFCRRCRRRRRVVLRFGVFRQATQ